MKKSLTELISSTRLDGYLGKNSNSLESIILRYNFNIEISKCFYTPLHLLEVAIRNNLSIELGKYLGDQQWLMNYDSHCIFHKREQKKISLALAKVQEKNRPLEMGRIIAELNFGFWCNLYDRPYMEFQKKTIKNQYPYASRKQRNIFNLKNSLYRIRLLRNRIFHYEPIWHWVDLQIYFDDIKQLLCWINPELCITSFNQSEIVFKEQIQRQEILLK